MRGLFKSAAYASGRLLGSLFFLYMIFYEYLRRGDWEYFLLDQSKYPRYGRYVMPSYVVVALLIFIPSAVKFYKLALAPVFEAFILRRVRERKTKLVFAAGPRQMNFFFCDVTAIMIPQEWGAFDYPFAVDPSWDHKYVCIYYLPKTHIVLSIALLERSTDIWNDGKNQNMKALSQILCKPHNPSKKKSRMI